MTFSGAAIDRRVSAVRLPAEIESAILAQAGMAGLGSGPRAPYARRIKQLREQMARLSAEFAPGVSRTPQHADAYSLYNFPANFMKTMLVLLEARRSLTAFAFPGARSRLRMLDIGCGEGAAMLGAYHALADAGAGLEFRMTGIDASARMLARGRQMVRRVAGQDARLKARFVNLDAGNTQNPVYDRKYDVILCVNSLAEIYAAEILPRDYMGRLYGALADDGLLVIIEPALKIYSRRLMELRDGLTRHTAMQVILPCLHSAPCALVGARGKEEWCHQSRAWSPPAFLRILNEGLHREIDVLKFSYLVIVRARTAPARPDAYRVVSQRLREKGRTRCYLCGPEGRIELVRLNRSRSAANAPFDRVAKGQAVVLENVCKRKPDYWEIAADTKVTIV